MTTTDETAADIGEDVDALAQRMLDATLGAGRPLPAAAIVLGAI